MNYITKFESRPNKIRKLEEKKLLRLTQYKIKNTKKKKKHKKKKERLCYPLKRKNESLIPKSIINDVIKSARGLV